MASDAESGDAAALLKQLDEISQTADKATHPPQTTSSHKSSSRGSLLKKKTTEEEDEERFGCSWAELDEKLRFHLNWEVRRDTLYHVRDNARKKDPRVMATLKYMARRDPNVNVKLTAAEILIHVGMQTLPEQIWMLGHEDWLTRKNAIDTLEFAAEPEDDAVMTALSLSIQDASATVRESAVQSLMALARKRKNSEHQFPPFVQQQLLERLGDVDSRVRKSAAAGITEVAVLGDRDLVQDLARKMTSRVSLLRRGASEVLKLLALKFDEVNDRSKRHADPHCSPLAQIQKLMLHEDVLVQRAALDAMQAISDSTKSLYAATDEVVKKNKACQGERKTLELEDDIVEASDTALGSMAASSPLLSSPLLSLSGTDSRLQTGKTFMDGSQAASSPHGGKDHSDVLDLTDSGSEEEREVSKEEGVQEQTKAMAPQNRAPTLPVGFRKQLAAAQARGDTPNLAGSSAF